MVVSSSASRAVYDITGPELLDTDARGATFAELTGKPVEVVQVDDEAYAAGHAEATGLPIDASRLYASFGRAAREGYLEVISSDFEQLTGRAPRSLSSVLQTQGAPVAA